MEPTIIVLTARRCVTTPRRRQKTSNGLINQQAMPCYYKKVGEYLGVASILYYVDVVSHPLKIICPVQPAEKIDFFASPPPPPSYI